MPHIKNIQSRTNRPTGGGPKKAGIPDHSDYPRIPYKIFNSRIPKLFLFRTYPLTGKSNNWHGSGLKIRWN
jgi:hypothetical protein